MGKINLAITGCMGRMGQQLINSANKDRSTKLVALTENKLIKKNLDLSLNDNQKKEKINYEFTPPLENELKYFFK